jgi:Mn-dependent DtxR family transcriptional regulator
MTQGQILELLEREPEQWFSYKGIARALGISERNIMNSLSRLRRDEVVNYKLIALGNPSRGRFGLVYSYKPTKFFEIKQSNFTKAKDVKTISFDSLRRKDSALIKIMRFLKRHPRDWYSNRDIQSMLKYKHPLNAIYFQFLRKNNMVEYKLSRNKRTFEYLYKYKYALLKPEWRYNMPVIKKDTSKLMGYYKRNLAKVTKLE